MILLIKYWNWEKIAIVYYFLTSQSTDNDIFDYIPTVNVPALSDGSYKEQYGRFSSNFGNNLELVYNTYEFFQRHYF